MRTLLPPGLHPSLRRELDTCIHVLEPLASEPSTLFSESLRGTNPILSPPRSHSLTTTTILRNQMDLFKQRYLANRQLVEGGKEAEGKPEGEEKRVGIENEVPTMSEKEKEHEQRLQQIREEMNKRRQTNF